MRIFLLLLAFAASADLGAFSRLYVFGDSLSDAGNVDCPLPLSEGGRWTNGKVWNEYLAEMLGLPVPTCSGEWTRGEGPEAGKNNFACAGGKIKSRYYPISSLEEQINGAQTLFGRDTDRSFLRYGAGFSPSDLVAIWGGANDYLMDFSGGRDWIEKTAAASVDDQIANIERLIALGARHIVAVNLPDMGAAPLVVFSGNATYFSSAFNSRFASALEGLAKRRPEVAFYPVDVFAMMSEIMRRPADYGFEFTERGLVRACLFGAAGDPEKYVFYDGLHPTTHMHRILAEKIYRRITEGGR